MHLSTRLPPVLKIWQFEADFGLVIISWTFEKSENWKFQPNKNSKGPILRDFDGPSWNTTLKFLN